MTDHDEILANANNITNREHYFTQSYGCQMNENDTERLAGQLEKLGYTATDDLRQAAVIVLNTCCVRESAENKIYGKIGELKRLKTANPDLIIVIAGCLAQKEQDRLFKRAAHVDLVLGTQAVHQLQELIPMIKASRAKTLAVPDQASEPQPDEPVVRKNKVSAWVPIMYGCNNFCTYCIVPYVRGRERSRALADIVTEIDGLGRRGFKEVTLLGQNVNSYGKDLPSHADFAELLGAVDKIDTIDRIRYMTSHPRDLNDRVIEAVRTGQRICEHFHLPIQTGCDELLTRMNRGYTVNYYRDLVTRIRQAIPAASLTTDIIVGFPGETEAMFTETLDFVKTVQFDAAYTFLYSPRSGTPAATMPDQLPAPVKKERLQRLMQIQNDISLNINRQLVGRVLEVLVEGESKNDANNMMGRTRTNKIVIWEKTGQETVGQLIQVKITAGQTWVLKGHRA